MLLICGASSCAVSDKHHAVDSTDVLTFQTEWPYTPRYSGVFTDPLTGVESIFLGDPITHLVVRVFDPFGTPLHDIPLGPVLDSLDDINTFTLIAADSLLVLDERGTKYAVVDPNGNVTRIRSLAQDLCDPRGDQYELYHISMGPAVLRDKLYLETGWVGACADTLVDDTSSVASIHRRYFAQATWKCKVAALDAHAAVAGLQLGACDILGHLTDTPRCTIGGVGRVVANGSVFVISPFSPFVMQIDTSSLAVARKIPIRCMNKPVGITPPAITENDIRRAGHDMRFSTQAYVLSFAFDAPSQHYLAVVGHEVPETIPVDRRSSARDWSLVVLDTSFNQIAEHVVQGPTYRAGTLLCLKRGVWTLVASSGRKAASEVKTFHRLRP